MKSVGKNYREKDEVKVGLLPKVNPENSKRKKKCSKVEEDKPESNSSAAYVDLERNGRNQENNSDGDAENRVVPVSDEEIEMLKGQMASGCYAKVIKFYYNHKKVKMPMIHHRMLVYSLGLTTPQLEALAKLATSELYNDSPLKKSPALAKVTIPIITVESIFSVFVCNRLWTLGLFAGLSIISSFLAIHFGVSIVFSPIGLH